MADSIDDPFTRGFLERRATDRAAGVESSLDDDRSHFPGKEEEVSKAYHAALSAERGCEGAAPTAQSAATFGPYLLIRELGRGGQGVVWLAEDTRLGRKVALKVLAGASPAEGHLARFKREAALASKLEHPGICGIHETGIEGGVPYIAMRYVKGETLSARLARRSGERDALEPSTFVTFDGRVDHPVELLRPASNHPSSIDRAEVDRTVACFEKIASALHAAHEVGIIHRDVKPGNIMVTEGNEPILLDFGLARHDDESGPRLTMTGDLFGTPAYMSPEQISGRLAALDRRSDIYSLGVTLFECLTRTRPFEAPTRESLYQAILSKDAPSVRKLNRNISADLDVVLQCAMEKDRDRRYQTGADLAEDLRRVRAGEPVLAKRVSALGRAWRWGKRRPAAAALLVVLMLGAPTLTGLGVWYWNHRDDVRAQEKARVDEFVEHALEVGFFELHHGSKQEALAAFERAVMADSASAESVVGLARAYLELDDAESALQVIERGETTVANPGVLARTRAEILVALARGAEAAAVLEQAPKIEGSLMWFIEGTWQMADAHDAGEKSDAGRLAFNRAAAMLTRAVGASSRPRRAYYFELAHALGHARDYGTDAVASAAVADVIENLWPEAATARGWSGFATRASDSAHTIAAYRAAIRLDPELADAHFNLGNALEERGNLDEAIRAWRESVRLDPRHAATRVNLGTALKVRGQLDEALVQCQEAARLAPHDASVRASVGSVLEAQGRLDAAIASYEEAARIDPSFAKAFREMGVALRKKGKVDEACAAYRRAVEIEPLSAVGQINFSLALMELGQLEEALVHGHEAIRIAPKDARCRAGLGHVHLTRGELDEAVVAFREAIDIEPSTPAAFSGLASAWERLGEPDESIRCYREAVRIDPDDVAAYRELGDVLEAQDRRAEAIDAYREAIRIVPGRAVDHFNLAYRLAALLRFDEALVSYDEAIRIDGGLADAYCNRGLLLGRLGRCEASVRDLRRGHELGLLRGASWTYPSADWLEDAYLAWSEQLDVADQLERAITVLEEAMRAFPTMTRLRGPLARLVADR